MAASVEKEPQWVRDGHTLIWDEDGPLLTHPKHCPFVYKELEPSGFKFRVYECIPGIEEAEEDFSPANYKGDFEELPWENPYMIEGEMGIEWYYEAYWVEGLPNGDEYYNEFGWREVPR